MDKITLKPTIKELLHRNAEEGVYFDVLSYQGAGNQEKSLGSLFMVSLASSLAKREYYSEESIQGQDAKKAFEHTLGKLNEVLDDFFTNKNLKLNIGLAAIAGNDIYISRLGKLKVALARDGKYIDILNNVDLFRKDSEDAKQFSNIISGKLHPQDKIFAYFPTRTIVAREKQLNDLFVKEDQNVFGQKIAHLATNANNFSCCGVHIDMREIKEIPVETRASYSRPVLASKPSPGLELSKLGLGKPEVQSVKSAPASSIKADETAAAETAADEEETIEETVMNVQESPRIIPAEFSITKRANLLTPMFKQFSKVKNFGQLGVKAKSRGFMLIAAIIIIPLIAITVFRSIGPSSVTKDAITKAKDTVKLAQSRLNQSDTKEARSLLQAALLNITGIDDKKVNEVRSEIDQTLGSINRTSDKQPQLYFDPTTANSTYKAALIAAPNDSVVAINAEGAISSITQSGISELAQLKTISKFLFGYGTAVSSFNGLSEFGVYHLETKKTWLFSLKEEVATIDALVYEGNLYLLADNSIYKYADAVTGGTKRTVWGSDNTNGTLAAITADGNIYALNTDGKLIKYFKGAKEGEVDLQIIPSSDSRIFTFKDSAFMYLTDRINGLVYVFDKTTGELKTTYDLSSTGSVWALSADGKVWVIR